MLWRVHLMREQLIANVSDHGERLTGLARWHFDHRNFKSGGLQRSLRDRAEEGGGAGISDDSKPVADAGRVTSDQPAEFGEQTFAHDDLVTLAGRGDGNGGGGRHDSGMLCAERSASLTSAPGIEDASGLPNPTMPDDPTLPASPAPDPAPSPGTGLAPNVAAGICCIFTARGKHHLPADREKGRLRPLLGGSNAGAVHRRLCPFHRDGNSLVILGAIHLFFLVRILSPLYSLGMFAIWIICIIKAFTGKKWEIPVISNYVPTVLGWFKTA